MKKVITIVIIVFLIGIGTINAAEATNIPGHQMVPDDVNFYQGPTKTLTSGYATATGNHVYMSLSTKGSLPNYLKSSSARKIFLDVYEYDVYPNADEKVIAYRADFSGRTIQSVYVYSLYIEDNIDSLNDKTAELYVNARLSKIAGDPKQSSGQFYTYKIGLR